MSSRALFVPAWLIAAAVGGATSWLAMERWTPDSAIRIPPPRDVVERAFYDAAKLGYRTTGKPRFGGFRVRYSARS